MVSTSGEGVGTVKERKDESIELILLTGLTMIGFVLCKGDLVPAWLCYVLAVAFAVLPLYALGVPR